jgi:CoA:oxalate CoA-transferase
VTGQGQMVDVAMLDSVVAVLENAISRYTSTGEVPGPLGNRHPAIFPFEPFETSDGQIMVAAGNDELWARLCRTLDRPELAADPRFSTNPLRHDNYVEMQAALATAFRARTTAAWQQMLDSAGVPNGPINRIDEVIRDPQVLAREMMQTVEHPVAGKMQLPGVPIKLSATPGGIRRPAPVLGEHTNEVLQEWLAWSDEEIAKMRARGAFGPIEG